MTNTVPHPTTNLRKQLARNLYKVLWNCPLSMALNLPPVDENNPHDIPWLRVADECLRQMEWAAFCATLSHRESEGYDDKEDALEASHDFVTLAPDDWTPKETQREN